MDDGQKLYENYFLVSVRIARSGNHIFLRGECKAEMTKYLRYITDIVVEPPSTVDMCKCECPAGEGPTAHCKHVVALLLGVVQMAEEKKIILQPTCTQQLQSFHRPRKAYFGTPLKCKDLPSVRDKLDSISFEPFPIKEDDYDTYKRQYNNRVQNLCINFCGSFPSTMPFRQTIMPANPYGVVWDHCYVSNPEEDMLRQLKVFQVSEEEITRIEEATRNQADDALWHTLRRSHLTASNFYNICTCLSEQAKVNLAQRIINPIQVTSKYLQHGKDYELKALSICQKIGVEVKKCGLFLCKPYPFLGASPDGLIGDDAVLEIKCPYNQRYMTISADTMPFLKKDDFGNLYLQESHKFYYQIQGQMYITNRRYAKLLIYTFKEICIIDIPRNDQFIEGMICKLKIFYNSYFKSALLEKHLYKNYGQCFSK